MTNDELRALDALCERYRYEGTSDVGVVLAGMATLPRLVAHVRELRAALATAREALLMDPVCAECEHEEPGRGRAAVYVGSSYVGDVALCAMHSAELHDTYEPVGVRAFNAALAAIDAVKERDHGR